MSSACAFAMFIQDHFIKKIGMKATYLFGLLTFAVSMLLIVISPSVLMVNICAAWSGIGTAVANTIPGTLITKYHTNPEVYLNRQKYMNRSVQGM